MSGVLTERHDRFWESANGDPAEVAFGIDCDRITYSSAFRRLSGVTQVVSADETALFHNRLTHSIKVAQVGIRLARKIHELRDERTSVRRAIERFGTGVDPRVVRAACLAHDLGHPPFGHIAENELQRILAFGADPDADHGPPVEYRLLDSFEGNAQTFRIVTRLSFRSLDLNPLSRALDPTRATLRAILKYPWMKNEELVLTDETLTEKRRTKWGAYDSEAEIFRWARGPADEAGRVVDFFGTDRVEYRTIEAQIMDLADDITYAVHDIEDFFRAGLIPLHTLRHSKHEFELFFKHAWTRIAPTLGRAITQPDAYAVMDGIRLTLFPESAYTGSRADREQLHVFASQMIGNTINSVKATGDGFLLPGREQLAAIEMLKEMTWFYVIKRPALSSAQRGQARLIRELYLSLIHWVDEERKDLENIALGADGVDSRRFPARLLDYLVVAFSSRSTDDTPERKVSRAVVDYIVSLTESQAIALTARLSGTSRRSMLETWLQG
ncbi:deoxyguanosinetriphosphate triphosphohydrolase family protein [Flindersiella endophytica]